MTIPDDILERLPPKPYDEVRPTIQDGDIMLCSAHDPMSRLIRWATKSPWSHIGIAIRVHQVDRVLVLECVAKLGTRAVTLSDFISRTSNGTHPYPGKILQARHEKLNADPGIMPRMSGFAFDRLGSKYSNAETAKIAMRVALGRLNIRMPGRLNPADEFICSEYVARCFAHVGLPVPWDGLGFIAPADFANDPALHPVAQIQTR